MQVRHPRVNISIVKAIALLVAPTKAVPTSALSATSNTTTAAPPSETSSAASGSDRNAPFQVLVDGTQDLVALVGIFATDSVERYAIDYNKGYLSAAAATLSLLGLLGYLRALFKLGLGPGRCENAGYDTKALRPLFGIPAGDRLPTDAVYNVYYVHRAQKADHIEWRLVIMTKHTVDSMALLAKAVPFPSPNPRRIDIKSCSLEPRSQTFRTRKGFLRVPILWSICIGMTCFMNMPFRGNLRHQAWTMYYATFGLFSSILGSSLAWAWVYAQEQLPPSTTDWVYYHPAHPLPLVRSLQKQDYFAFIGSGNSYATFNLQPIVGWIRTIIRTLSLFAAMSGIIGYVNHTLQPYTSPKHG